MNSINKNTVIRRLIALWLCGLAAIGLVTALCFRLDLHLATAVQTYLLVVVLISFFDSAITSVLLSVVAVACLNYFFTEPIFTFRVDYVQDGFGLIAFVITSLVITGLVRRGRRLADVYRERADLLDLTHDTVIARDSNDVIVDWNRGAEELYGWSRREALGRTSHDLLQTGFPVPFDEITATLLRTGRWDGELIHSRRDGTQVTVSSRWAVRRDRDGAVIGVLETNNDITDNKRAQERLRRTQAAYLGEAQKLSMTGSFGWEVETGELFWSEETFRIFGYDQTVTPSLELVMQRVHPNDVIAVQQSVDRVLQEKSDFDFEHRLLMPDGSIKQLRVITKVVEDEPGRLQFAGAVMDVTAAKRAEERWQRAQSELAYAARVNALGQVTASITHEINQPLAAIVSSGHACLRWLNREVPRVEEATASARHIIEDGRRASEIIQRIKALFQNAEQQRAEIDLNDVVREVIPLVQREILDNRITLRLDLGPGLPNVLGDRVQLQQVIINLVMNSIQSMTDVAERPRVLVISSRADAAGAVSVAVQDSGAGVSPESASWLFDAFFTTKPQGMGMGLSICRSIIEAHNGRIWTEPANDAGAIFRFSLPAMPRNAR
jgi:PAS domain S-box-containing protein